MKTKLLKRIRKYFIITYQKTNGIESYYIYEKNRNGTITLNHNCYTLYDVLAYVAINSIQLSNFFGMIQYSFMEKRLARLRSKQHTKILIDKFVL